MPPRWLERRVLLGPAALRRAAARRARDKQERWMLEQPLEVRRSYVREVLDRGRSEEVEQAWMLLQPEDVRRAYVRDVLGIER